ncbi:MAG TPA: PEP/pyruvate-binding domain-containing protein [Vicinamibacteria bacterium]|nr:PEP/pyruvate-binding domain-containing protein [Vicinamibacteria bacterium]
MAELPSFARRFFGADETFTSIGGGEIGGKAAGLRRARQGLDARPAALRFASLAIEVPTLTVIGTAVFEEFLARNRLDTAALAERDDREIAHAFQRGELPPAILGDLWALVREVRAPLAVRSSSRLEDALAHPFAGVYATKMTPNNQHDPESRFRRLTEAVKFVFASTFLEGARAYRASLGPLAARESMAVIVQEVVGRRHGPRFYPDLSCVARSLNYYPFGPARPEDGVMSLALGLGKQIVDGGRCFTLSPRHPGSGPPFASAKALLDETQTSFWAVNMGPSPAYDPAAETEYLVSGTLAEAETDGALGLAASTYDWQRDRVVPGLSAAGPRVIDFAPLRLWHDIPWSEAVGGLLEQFERDLGAPVEVELAATFEGGLGRLGFLQVRPMAAAAGDGELADADLASPLAVVASERALGHGAVPALRDVVFLRPRFDMRDSPAAARELVEMNRALLEAGRPYLLIGFGRWGSSDAWLGVPVQWGHVSGARALVEMSPEGRVIEPSQGSHFFHNLLGLGVPYLQVAQDGRVDWEFLLGLPRRRETPRVIHAECAAGLCVRVDGRRGRGVVLRSPGEAARA